MPTYFGQCDSSGNPSGDTDDYLNIHWECYTGKSFVCPGSGTQTVKDLSGYVKINASTPNIRLVIYDNAGNKVCEGSGQVALSGASYSWQGHLTQASITPNPTTLTGGASYRIGICSDANQTGIYAQSGGSSSDSDYGAVDYTGGWPATIPGNEGSVYWQCLRVGVDAATATIDQLAVRARNDDGDEAGATFAAAENAMLTAPAGTRRFRFQLNNTGDPAAITPQFDWERKPSGGAWGTKRKIR